MDNTVTQEVFKRIDTIAEKLGTTAAYLWPKLVVMEAAGAWASLLFILVPVAFGFATYVFYKKYTPGVPYGANVYGVWATILGAITIITLVGSIASLIHNIPIIASPEAAAFYKLVGR